jgi:hypothetical protein
MTGSVALDVVIGLVFIFLLYSLLATILCEIIALHLGLRARNLQQAIRRMLEDSPETSEWKVTAFFKNIWQNVSNFFFNREGPGACVFYNLPVIKYLARNTLYSKPSYITRQNFSKGIMEIFRHYGGDDATPDLEKIQNVLKGALAYPGVLKEIKDAINSGTKVDVAGQAQKIDYSSIRQTIEAKANALDATLHLDAAQKKLFAKIQKALESSSSPEKDKAAVYTIDELLNLFGHETRSHLTSLLKDANNDLLKFRLHLEQWFDDTMDRATGWYKQKIQFVLLIIGLVLALGFNANTLDIVKKLSVDTDARDKLVQMASDYVKDPVNKLPEGLIRFSAKDSLKLDSVRKVRLDSLEKVRTKLQKQMDGANSLIGMGWIKLPDSLKLLSVTKEDSLKKLKDDKAVTYMKIKLDNPKQEQFALLIYTNYTTKGILSCIDETSWFWEPDVFTGYNKKATKIAVDHGLFGDIEYSFGNLFSSAGWGFLLTALAISLGAPFWFDMLNKLVQVRGAIKEPTKAQAGGDTATAGPSVSDPSHVINRKG